MGIEHELITRGWHQGDYRGPDGSVCLYGACIAAALGSKFDLSDNREIRNVLIDGKYGRALVQAVFDLYDAPFVASFNDAPDRTFDEVLRVAKEADEILGL